MERESFITFIVRNYVSYEHPSKKLRFLRTSFLFRKVFSIKNVFIFLEILENNIKYIYITKWEIFQQTHIINTIMLF